MYKSRIPAIAAALNLVVTAAIRTGSEAVAQEAKTRVTVATGRLRDSIHVDQEGDDVYVIAGDDNTFYGHFVEFGTSRVPAKPFLVPALESRREEILTGVKAALRTL